MKLIALFEHVDYEGDSLLGVYASLKETRVAAKAFAKAEDPVRYKPTEFVYCELELGKPAAPQWPLVL